MPVPAPKPNEKVYTITADERGGGHVILTIAVDAGGVMRVVAADPAPPPSQ